MYVNKSHRADNFARKYSENDIREAIKAIIKYYGDCRKALKELHDRGVDFTESSLYQLKCGIHVDTVEEYMPIGEFRKLKELKIRHVCEALVRNNGSIMDTYRELKDKIPNINTVYIEKVLYKEKRPDISDEYFEKDQYKQQDYYAPGSACFDVEYGPDEEWRPVVYRDVKLGMYEVSNYGRVRNVNGRENLHLIKRKQGYIKVHLMCEHNFRKAIVVHQLVATAFIPNPYAKPYVNHMDLNPGNNYYKNLEWCNHDENMFHSTMNHNFTGCDNDSKIRKRAMFLNCNHVSVELTRAYAEMHHGDFVDSEACRSLFFIVNRTMTEEQRQTLIFNDLIYKSGVYIFIYSVHPRSYVLEFLVLSDMVEELTTYEIRDCFFGRATKVNEDGIYTVITVVCKPLNEPYWDERYIEEYHGCKMLTKDLPYDVERFIELAIDRLAKS